MAIKYRKRYLGCHSYTLNFIGVLICFILHLEIRVWTLLLKINKTAHEQNISVISFKDILENELKQMIKSYYLNLGKHFGKVGSLIP